MYEKNVVFEYRLWRYKRGNPNACCNIESDIQRANSHSKKKIREKYGIYPSTPIKWVEKKEGILMVPETEDPIIAARGMKLIDFKDLPG